MAFDSCAEAETHANYLICVQKFMVFGKTGWIGGLLGEILTKQGANWEFANARLEDRAALIADIERVRPPAPKCCDTRALPRIRPFGKRSPLRRDCACATERAPEHCNTYLTLLPLLGAGEAHAHPQRRGPHRPPQRGLV